MWSRRPRPFAIAETAPAAGGGALTDREFVRLHWPSRSGPSFDALFAIDEAMADVVARSREPTLAAIKLAWWRERLEALDQGDIPAEPRLRAVARHLLARGISGARLAGLEPGWACLLQPEVDPGAVAQRGALLFALGAELLAADDRKLADAGALYALSATARRGLPALFEPAGEYAQQLVGHRFGRGVRPLTMLARAAARDVARRAEPEPEGSRARMAAMLAHRWSGRIRG